MKSEYLVEIHGTRPYLMHAFRGPEQSKKKGRQPTFEEDCEAALYRRADKTIYVPSLQVWASMRKASANFKLKGRQSFFGLVNSGVLVDPDEIPIEPQTWKQFVSPVVIQRNRILKARPQFDDWRLRFKLTVVEERLTESVLKDILTEAGLMQGIGDWRPRFGAYEITRWAKYDGTISPSL